LVSKVIEVKFYRNAGVVMKFISPIRLASAVAVIGSVVSVAGQSVQPVGQATTINDTANPNSPNNGSVTMPAVQVQQTGPVTPERVADYVLGPDDQIVIRAFQAEEISDKPFGVLGDGYVSLPLVGRVKAGGLTVQQFETELTQELHKYIEHPQVTVLVSDYRSQPVSVMGAVGLPGVVQLRGEKSLLQVISLAGGLRPEASNTVTITRLASEGHIPLPEAKMDTSGRFSTAQVNVRSVMEARTPEQNIVIKKGDVLTVPRAKMVYVIGEVQKPGGYVLSEQDSLSVLKALSLAGGVTKLASVKHARILHEQDGQAKEVEGQNQNDVAKILAGQSPDIALHADDILFVPTSKAKAVGYKAADTAVTMAGMSIFRF
jgi:polysaccharide export outer membrane protein